MDADNLIELQPERPAGDRGHTCQPWLSHAVLLGRPWCGKRKFFVFLTLPCTFKAAPLLNFPPWRVIFFFAIVAA